MGNKAVIEKLFALPMGGDFDALTIVLGDIFDEVDAEIDSLLLEASPSTALDTFDQWLKDYSLAFDSADTIAWKRQVLLARMNELGGLSIPYYVDMAARYDEVVAIRDSIVFKFGDKFGGTFYGAEHVHSFVLTLKEQHRFPFKFGDKFGGKFLSYDKRNSMEELFQRLKPAHTKIFFKYFNWGFEAGDLSEWLPFFAVIDNVVVRTGTYSAKLVATGADILGIGSYPFVIASNRQYEISYANNVPTLISGTYRFEIYYYSDLYGQNFISSEILLATSTVTPGWIISTRTVGPVEIPSQKTFPATAKSFRLKQSFDGGTPNGIAYIDDIDISLV